MKFENELSRGQVGFEAENSVGTPEIEPEGKILRFLPPKRGQPLTGFQFTRQPILLAFKVSKFLDVLGKYLRRWLLMREKDNPQFAPDVGSCLLCKKVTGSRQCAGLKIECSHIAEARPTAVANIPLSPEKSKGVDAIFG